MSKASLISPSYFTSGKDMVNIEKNIQKIGFGTFENLISKEKFFKKWAGNPGERLNSFYKAWNSDSEIIFCSNGGSGAIHWAPMIDKRKLKKRKLLVGYSDITILLNLLYSKLNIISIHGPNMSKRLDDKTISSLKDAIQMKRYSIKFNQKDCRNVSKGTVKGKIMGGNLERLTQLMSCINLDFKNKIIFIEEKDVSEHKMFNLLFSLKHHRSFKPKAIIVGNLGLKNQKKINEIMKNLFKNTPLIFCAKFGHQNPNISIPIGAKSEIDFKDGKINFLFQKKDRGYSVNSLN